MKQIALLGCKCVSEVPGVRIGMLIFRFQWGAGVGREILFVRESDKRKNNALGC